MSEEVRKRVEIPADHTLKMTGSRSEQRKGKDTDIETYEELNPAGDVVAKYELHEAMSIYPPFGTTVSVRKVG